MTDKINVFSNVVDFFHSFKKKAIKEDIEDKREFKQHLISLEEGGDLYIYINTVVELANKALQTIKNKEDIKKKIKETEIKMHELKTFNNLDDRAIKEFEGLAFKHLEVAKEKTRLYEELVSFDKNLNFLTESGEDAKAGLPRIVDSEKKQKAIRNEIGRIAGERAELEYEESLLNWGIRIVKTVSIMIFFSFAVCVCGIIYSGLFGSFDILTPWFSVATVSSGLLFFLYVLDKTFRNKLKMNYKKQKYTGDLLNEKNAVISHYNNFLKNEYRKYKVTNSQMLRNRLKESEKYKYISNRYDTVRKFAYRVENEIESFLDINDLKITEPSISKFIKNLGMEEKQKLQQGLQKDIENLRKEIIELDLFYNNIWDKILMLNDGDFSENHIVDKIINDYYEMLNKQNLDEFYDINEFDEVSNIPSQTELEQKILEKVSSDDDEDVKQIQ